MLAALEVTAGLALVRPAHHAALSGRGFALRGADSRMALRVTWDDRGTTRFEWLGAADASVTLAPRRRAWDFALAAAGVTIWRSGDATALGSTAALATAVGVEGVDQPWPTVLVIRWAARKDGQSVELAVGNDGGAPLKVYLAPQF